MRKRMAVINLELHDEVMPGIEEAVNEVVEFLVNNRNYICPLARMLINLPCLASDINKYDYMKTVTDYLERDLEDNAYTIDGYSEKEAAKLIQKLTSYLAYYGDIDLQCFVQRNSRYASGGKSPEQIQVAVFNRLKGYLFESLVASLLKPLYAEEKDVFERGCIVSIDATEVVVRYKGETRKTIDIAGIKGDQRGIMLECKVHPNGITVVPAKYIAKLCSKMNTAGYSKVSVGFITAGTKPAARLKFMKQMEVLTMRDPGVKFYDIQDMVLLSA